MLSASSDDDKIAWYDDSQGNSEQRVISTQAEQAQDVYAADLDGDGDQDVLSASSGDDKIAWYANDGRGNFGEPQTITTQAREAVAVYAADLDSDGDQDVLSASSFGDKAGRATWYANDGQGRFGSRQVIAN